MTSDVGPQNLAANKKITTGNNDHLPVIVTIGSSDIPGAVFNLATSIIGTGIMAFPTTIKVINPSGSPLASSSSFSSASSLSLASNSSSASPPVTMPPPTVRLSSPYSGALRGPSCRGP
ncbi:hypothetical protein QJS04_geneDACA007503 [Acorus gramineus]|uniref:Uncharacterized protein n=1 Tax=Acorus gramineus TaxID=55184 RepID=A0AAV9B7G6_ACOGR|nr:hypothetical protein QJS04_geneDACA007503 [Acorus gramineus]